eukprot:g1823.t1
MFPSPVSNNNGPKRKSAFAKLGGGGGGGKKKLFGKLKKAASKAVPDLDKAIEKKKTSKNSALDMLHKAVGESMVAVQVKQILKEMAAQRRRVLSLEDRCDTIEQDGVSKNELTMIIEAHTGGLKSSRRERRKSMNQGNADEEESLGSMQAQIKFIQNLFAESVKESKLREEAMAKKIFTLEKKITKLEKRKGKKKGGKVGGGEDGELSLEEKIKVMSAVESISSLNKKIRELKHKLTGIDMSINDLRITSLNNSDGESGHDTDVGQNEELEYFRNSPIHNQGLDSGRIENSRKTPSPGAGSSNRIGSRGKSSSSQRHRENGKEFIESVSDWNGQPLKSGSSLPSFFEKKSRMSNGTSAMLKAQSQENKRLKKDIGKALQMMRMHQDDMLKVKGTLRDMRRDLEDVKVKMTTRALRVLQRGIQNTLGVEDASQGTAMDHAAGNEVSVRVEGLAREVGIIRQSLLLLASPEVSPILCACHSDHVRQLQELDRLRGQTNSLKFELKREQKLRRHQAIRTSTPGSVVAAETPLSLSRAGSPTSAPFARQVHSRLSSVRSLHSRDGLSTAASSKRDHVPSSRVATPATLAGGERALAGGEREKRLISAVLSEGKRINPVPMIGALKSSPRLNFTTSKFAISEVFPFINIPVPRKRKMDATNGSGTGRDSHLVEEVA